MSSSNPGEIAAKERFGFGRNWLRFLPLIDSKRIARAEESLRDMLEVADLTGRSFLDVGSGSGLFSLAARRLGARVHSFDVDAYSVECTRRLRRTHSTDDPLWTIEQGSVLDAQYLARLGQFDVVYSWGVLHHTGAMWQAIDRVAACVVPNGKLFLAIYNDQGWLSSYWLAIKRLFNKSPLFQVPLLVLHAPYLFGGRLAVRWVTHRLSEERGMSLWFDMIDWLGGYPFEVATPREVVAYLRAKDCWLDRLHTCGGRHGCNQYVFRFRPPAIISELG